MRLNDLVLKDLSEAPSEPNRVTFWENDTSGDVKEYNTLVYTRTHWDTIIKHIPDTVIGWTLHHPWKIVAVSNFDKECFAEYQICDNILNHNDARILVEAMNLKVTCSSPHYHQIKPQAYVLWKGMEEFV